MTVKRRVMGTVAALGLALSVSVVLAPVAAAGAAQPQGTQAEVIPASHSCSSAPDAPTFFGNSISITGSVSASCQEGATLLIGRSPSGSGTWLWSSTGVTLAPGQMRNAWTSCFDGTWDYLGAFRYAGGHITYGPIRTFTC